MVAYLSEGHTLENTKKVFKVSISTMRSWKKQLVELGHLKNRPLDRSFKKIDPEKLSAYVEAHPDAYLREMGEVFGCTDEAVRQALTKLKITHKKRRNATGNGTRRSERSLLKS